jgi:type I restriction enzyme M protein
MSNYKEIISFIWDLANLLRDNYKRNERQKVILPFTILKRFDSVLSDTKKEVLKTYETYKDKFDNLDFALRSASKRSFYNYSKYDFKTLLEDPEHIEQNMFYYIDCFSKNIQDIFENFYLKTHIERLAKSDLLYLFVKKFSESKVNLHPDVISNYEMGIIFEELVRRFSEQSNEEAGEHFTPREVVELMTHLMFATDEENIKKENLIITVYDPACGTGGMLTCAENYIKSINKKNDKFDFIISNPPYGKKWEIDEDPVKGEAEKGFKGRFGAGTPRINDGQLLFLQHMISKMKVDEKSRIAVITNGSPLFTGDAGGGESNIRKWMIENDYIEAIIALPNQLFYNTGINTYIWILTNKKFAERANKIKLIDATSFYKKMRTSLGNKRNEFDRKKHIPKIVELYEIFEKNTYCKVFDNEDFGYTKVTVERPLQLNYQVTEERLENLYSVNVFSKLAESNQKDPEKKLEGEEEGKRKQEEIISALKSIGNHLYKNWDEFEARVKETLSGFDLSPNLIKKIILALSEHDDSADYVLDKRGDKIPDSNLRDYEKVPLKQDIEEYFKKEVKPYYPDAWMDRKKDKRGYEINFNQYFYKYVSPRPLKKIEKDIKKVTAEMKELLRENV